MESRTLKKTVVLFSLFCLIGAGPLFALTRLQNVDVREIGSKTRLIIELSEKSDYRTSQLSDPLRVVINLNDKVSTDPMEALELFSGLIKSVRFVTLDREGADSGIVFLDAVIVELEPGSKYEIFDQDTSIMMDVFSEGDTAVSRVTDSLSGEERTDVILQKLVSAENNYKNEYYLLAKADCESVLDLEPGNERARKLLAKVEKKIEDELEKAEKLARRLEEEKARELEERKTEADRLSRYLEKEEVRAAAQEEDYDYYVKTGKNLYKRKRYEEAIEMWERARNIEPVDEEIENLIEKSREKIRERRARIQGEEEMPGEREEVESLLDQGTEQFSNLDYALAIETFEQVLDLDPGNLKAMRYLARAKRNQRLYVEEGGEREDVMMLPRSQEGDYGVLNLPDAINVGTANHLPTKISQEEVLLAKMKVREAKRALFPKAKIKYKTTQGTTTGEDFEGEEYAAEFQQNIYAGGKYRSLYNQARVNLAVARKNYEKTKAEFVFEVTQAYYNLAFAKAKMKHKLELYEKIKSLLEIAEKQYTAKALTLAEVLEARSQLEEARFQVREIENDLELASLALVQLLSLPRTASIDTIDIPEPIVFEIEPDELYEVGYKNRRDYQVKKLLVLFNKYGLEIARKKAGFNVELTGSYGRRDEYFISEEVDLKDEYYFGVKITRALGPHEVEINALSQDKVPQVGQTTPTEYDSSEIALKLWEQKTGTDIAEANIAYHKSLSELENSKRELVHDISSAIFSVREAEAKMENKQSAVSLASEELRSTRAKQQVDQATIVQVMRSESKWWNAKTELVSAQADYYVSIAKLNKNVGVNDYFDPAAGVVATDREGLTPGIRLMINEKSGKTPWWKKDPFAGGIPSYYPDEVVNDILREKQDEEVMGKKFLGIFKRKKDKEMAEYKSYDEKYDFSMPGEKKKKKWFFFGGKKLDDDFSRYYESREEYEDAFGIEEEEKTVSRISETAPFLSEETTETDYFEQYLEDKDRILFAQMHVEDSKYETALAIRANSKTEFTVSVLRDPYRLLVTMKDVVISALPDFEAVEKGAVESVKAFHTKTVLPSAYRDWKRLLSLIVELDRQREYSVESTDEIFKITVKK